MGLKWGGGIFLQATAVSPLLCFTAGGVTPRSTGNTTVPGTEFYSRSRRFDCLSVKIFNYTEQIHNS